jgi:hypothetical protein
MALVRTVVMEERIASVIRVEKISELGTTRCFCLSDFLRPDGRGDAFLRNIGSYKSHIISISVRNSDEVGRTCGTNGGEEERVQVIGRKVRGKETTRKTEM